MHVYAKPNGILRFHNRLQYGDDTLLLLGSGPRGPLRNAVEAVARHGYTKGVFLVPGVPEAETLEDAVEACRRFSAQLAKRGVAARQGYRQSGARVKL